VLADGVNAGAAVKKAAQQVENQAQILTTQLSNRVSWRSAVSVVIQIVSCLRACVLACLRACVLACLLLKTALGAVWNGENYFLRTSSFENIYLGVLHIILRCVSQRRSAQFLEEAEAVSAKLSNSADAEEDNDVPDFLSRLKKKR
jgi:hypothetical protein